jgi:hypothetical protein
MEVSVSPFIMFVWWVAGAIAVLARGERYFATSSVLVLAGFALYLVMPEHALLFAVMTFVSLTLVPWVDDVITLRKKHCQQVG